MKDGHKRRKIQACFFFFFKLHPWKFTNKDLKFHPRSLISEVSGSLVKDCEHLFFDGRQSSALVWKWKVKVKATQSCLTLRDCGVAWLHGLYSPWNSPGRNTWVGILSLLQGIFPAQALNPGLLHCSRILYQLSHKGSGQSYSNIWGNIL